MRQLDTAIRISSSGRGVPRGLTRPNPHPRSRGLVRAASLLLICILTLFYAVPARAEDGSLTGTIKEDPSGAVIIGANITARNVETGVQQTVKTNESGFYTFSPPGLDIVSYGFIRHLQR